jgi:hypothetical protein
VTTSTADQGSAESEIRALIEGWAKAVHAGDLDGLLAQQADDIEMFDVPPPNEVRGIEAYRDTRHPFFEWQKRGAPRPPRSARSRSRHGYLPRVATRGSADELPQAAFADARDARPAASSPRAPPVCAARSACARTARTLRARAPSPRPPGSSCPRRSRARRAPCGVRKVGSRRKLEVFASRAEFMHPTPSWPHVLVPVWAGSELLN